MKVMTILGTRPEIIRLSRIMPKLDSYCEHLLVHTGQNYECSLNHIFFTELGLRSPDYMLECKSETVMSQIGRILTECERVLLKEKPDRLLILGDTNSALAAVTAKRMNIPVFHLEAGNRCYDDRVPEEVNRRVVDHCSDILMPYTERSRANLIREGIDSWRIYVIGNPIGEVFSDSGTVQEECCILNIPNVTLRDVTERPETLEAGASLLSGCEPGSITRAVDAVLGMSTNWTPPKEYKNNQVSSTVTKILLGTG